MMCCELAFFIKSLNAFSGRLKLTVLSEDRLQMKWKEAEGPVQGYKVRVRPITGETALVIGKELRLHYYFLLKVPC